jgi:hypothetical protein
MACKRQAPTLDFQHMLIPRLDPAAIDRVILERLAGLLGGDVQPYKQTGVIELAQPCEGGISLILSTSRNDHACSRPGQPQSHAKPETAIAPGDERNAIAQVEELRHGRAHREASLGAAGFIPELGAER